MAMTECCGTLGKGGANGCPRNYPGSLFGYSGAGPWHTSEPGGCLEPRCAHVGPASASSCPPQTLPVLLAQAAEEHVGKPALRVERPLPELADGRAPPSLPDRQWACWTWDEYLKSCRNAAKAFIHLGMEPFESVAMWGFNSPEWMIATIAASMAGGKMAGLYPTDGPETVAYKVVQSGAGLAILEDRKKLGSLLSGLAGRGDCRRIKAIVGYGFVPEEREIAEVYGVGPVPLLSFSALLAMGEDKGSSEALDGRASAVSPGHCCGLIYTSGTTGEPKAVMISHDSVIYEAMTVFNILKNSSGYGKVAQQERILSYLPLSHVAGMMIDVVLPIAGSKGHSWTTVYFARSYDLKAGSLKDRLQHVRPTLFLGVPLVWEKIADKIRAIGASTTGLKKILATWAKGLALEYGRRCQLGGSFAAPLGYSLAEKLILSKVKSGLGLDQCKYGLTGAAPMRVETFQTFAALGININEVYGMSECTGAATASSFQAHMWGSCGWEIPGCEVKAFRVDEVDFNKKVECERAPSIDDVGDERYQGELCFRGRNIMMGYMGNPDLGSAHVSEAEKKTAETIDAEGWLHSGDKGMITKDGMVKITGRFKELIIGDGGENIAPVPIEDHVKMCCDAIADVMMIGDKRKYNVAIITLKAVGANGEGPGTDDLEAAGCRVNPQVTKISQAMDDPVWIETLTRAIQDTNKNAKVCVNNAFYIQKFTVLPHNFSEQENELTPTKKLKRKVVETRYAAAVDKLYSTDGTYIRF